MDTLTTLCRQAGLSRRTYYHRRSKGLDHEAALERPKQQGRAWAARKNEPAISALLRGWLTKGL
jgi:hypothetical protein